MGKLVNREELAAILGKNAGTITEWLRLGLPRVAASAGRSGDTYDTEAVIEWMVQREVRKLMVGENGELINFEMERARLTKEQADKVAMDNAIKRGDLMSASDVAKHWAGIIVNAKTRLLSIPTKAAPMVMGVKSLPVAREVIERFVMEALNELVAADFHPDGGGAPGVEAAPEVDSEPVGGPAPEVKPRGKRRARAVGD